jgi:hypothetical protein
MRTFRSGSIIAIAFSLVQLAANAHTGKTLSAYPADTYPADSSARKALARISRLAGDWTGSFQWSGGRSAKGKMDARYYSTGNGTAMVEDLLMDGKPMMTTVYHLDGPALHMTHYCAAGNQPRLKATTIDEQGSAIHFEFIDATNLSDPSAPHVTGLDLQIHDEDHIVLVFTFRKADSLSYEHIELSRTKNT